MGLVKNRTKQGDFYWVSAYVTPIYEAGEITGYESVRTRPSRDRVQRAEALYRQVNDTPGRVMMGDRLISIVRATWPLGVSTGLSVGAVVFLPLAAAIAVIGVSQIGAGLLVTGNIARRMKRLLALRPDAFRNRLIAKGYTAERGLFADLAMTLVSEEARIETVLGRIEDQALSLKSRINEGHGYIRGSAEAVGQQKTGTDQVASAITQMTASIQDVSGVISQSAEEARTTHGHAVNGGQVSSEALRGIQALSDHVISIRDSIEHLGEATASISKATTMIDEIAEQTNLLALNAAIEAARAGDQGRGFAVVADEVRQLASRTRESTTQIGSLIAQFKEQVDESVEATRMGETLAREGLSQVTGAEDALQEIVTSVGQMTDRFAVVRDAISQQQAVSEDIARQVVTISELADSSSEQAVRASGVSEDLGKTSQGLYDFIARFSGTLAVERRRQDGR
jgi:aerotaxis receptor